MMKHQPVTKAFKHVCPRKCPSSCTMISYSKNNRLIHMEGDPANTYTKGKICAKAFSYIQKNNHPERLKYPYYQKVKGSGKFKQITWERAYDLIIRETMSINEENDSFLPIGLYKGTGNIGVHHHVTEDFFTSIGPTTRVNSDTSLSTNYIAIQHSTTLNDSASYFDLGLSSIIILWGANPAVSNIHLIPYLIEEKIKGTKIVVIDPIYTQTAELADLYIQLRPSTDGLLANLLIESLRKNRLYQKKTVEVDEYLTSMNAFDSKAAYQKCDVSDESIKLLVEWLKNTSVVSVIIGAGIQKHANAEHVIQSIKMVAAVHAETTSLEGTLYCRFTDSKIFNNQSQSKNEYNRSLNFNQLCQPLDEYSIQMLWISCANPLIQQPNPKLIQNRLKDIPFVVTVEHFMTPTALMSNLVLPTTSHFEECDIIVNEWHGEIAFNEKAISPYYESKSEWKIMTELASRLNQSYSDICTFPIYSSEEEYLNAQFNEQVDNRYSIKSIEDLKIRSTHSSFPNMLRNNKELSLTMMHPLFSEKNETQSNQIDTENLISKKMPTKEYPFWLLTPHQPYAFNSQFHYLHLNNEGEAFAAIHPSVAKALRIFDGEIIKIVNEQDSIEIKAVYSNKVAKDIIMIYQGWYPDSDVTVNHLIPLDGHSTKSYSFDTFVTIQKL